MRRRSKVERRRKLTGAHMSGYMLGTSEGRLTYGTFVVASHRCRVEWAKVVSEQNKIINAKMSDYAYTRIHTLSLQGTGRVILNDSPSPHILSRENTDVISLSPSFLLSPLPILSFSTPSIASSSRLIVSSSHVYFFLFCLFYFALPLNLWLQLGVNVYVIALRSWRRSVH